MMRTLPEGQSLLIRTDFSDDESWRETVAAAGQPWDLGSGDYSYADLTPVDDPAFGNLTLDELATLIGSPPPYYVFIADALTISDPQHPILAVNTRATTSGYPTFRVAPSGMASVENNLSLANMDFEEFASAVGDDQVFRGFDG